MKNLPNVDLALIDCVNPEKALAVISHCSKMFNFGNVKIQTAAEQPEFGFESGLHEGGRFGNEVFAGFDGADSAGCVD